MLIKILCIVLAVANIQALSFNEELHKAQAVVDKLPNLTEQEALVRLRQEVKDLKLSLNRVKACIILFQSSLQVEDVNIPKRYEIYTTQMKNIIVDIARSYQQSSCSAGSMQIECSGYEQLLGKTVTQWLIKQRVVKKKLLSDSYSKAYEEIVQNAKPFDNDAQSGFLFKIMSGVQHVSQMGKMGNIATEVSDLVKLLRSAAI